MKIISRFLPLVSNKYGKRLHHSRARCEKQSCEPIPKSSLDIIFAEHEKSPILHNKIEEILQGKEELDMVLGEG